MMLRIEYIRLRLPNSMHSQAANLPSQLADALAKLSFSQSLEINALFIPPLTFERGQSIKSIAKQMANAIHQQIAEGNP